MTYDKKGYLGQYLIQQAKINRLNQMIAISPDQKQKFISEINNAENLRNEIEEKIRRVDNGVLSELLFLKYVCGKTLLEISYSLNYSNRQIERMHIKAITLFRI